MFIRISLILLFASTLCIVSWKTKPDDLSRINETLQLLHKVYGPLAPHYILKHRTILYYDFNGNGINDILILFGDPGLEDLSNIKTFHHFTKLGATVTGFALFTYIDSRWWPVFYHVNEYRMSLRFKTLNGSEALVSEGGKDHTQSMWYWDHTAKNWEPTRWKSRWRVIDSDDYGPWKVGRYFNVIQGK